MLHTRELLKAKIEDMRETREELVKMEDRLEELWGDMDHKTREAHGWSPDEPPVRLSQRKAAFDEVDARKYEVMTLGVCGPDIVAEM